VGNLRKTEDTMMKGDGMGGLLFGVYAWFTVIALTIGQGSAPALCPLGSGLNK